MGAQSAAPPAAVASCPPPLPLRTPASRKPPGPRTDVPFFLLPLSHTRGLGSWPGPRVNPSATAASMSSPVK